VRPRALLHATAICLLLAAATVWATPASLFKLLARSQKAASAAKAALAASKSERALLLLRAGKTKEALPILDELIKAKRIENTPEAIALATELEHQVALLRATSSLETLEQLAASVLAPVNPLAPLAPQLKLLHKIDSRLSRVSVVEGSVKEFSKGFEAGARDPGRFLSEVRLQRPALLSEWLAAPQEKRIFIIGAGEDSAKVSELPQSLKSDGYAVFFYKFCRQSSGELCSDQAVGAMFGTAGHAMLYHTPFATRSKYVQVEVATARYLAGLDRRVILISPSELLDSLDRSATYGSATFAMYVADMPTPTPSPVK
jgi:hypothetical protein